MGGMSLGRHLHEQKKKKKYDDENDCEITFGGNCNAGAMGSVSKKKNGQRKGNKQKKKKKEHSGQAGHCGYGGQCGHGGNDTQSDHEMTDNFMPDLGYKY